MATRGETVAALTGRIEMAACAARLFDLPALRSSL